VVRAYSRGLTGEGQPYVVLELVAGQSLRARLDTAGPLPWREVIQIGAWIAAALESLHARGVIHRDVKPGNIMLTTDDTGAQVVKLLDFGIARLTDQYDELRGPGPHPAAPAAADRGRRGDRHPRVHAARGWPRPARRALRRLQPRRHAVRAVHRQAPGARRRRLATRALPGCDAPDDLAAVLAAALALEPADRTQTAGELGRALAAVRAAHPEHTPSPLHDGRYELISVLGTGARADVMLANHRGSRHDVALKLLRSSHIDDVRRFQREAQILALLEHPTIPRYYDYAPASDPPYIAMACAPGVPAAKFCQLADADRLSPVEVAQVGWQVAQVLAFIHQRGVLHRDINANNVLIDLPRASPMRSERVRLERTPTVTLVDFGNAALTEKFYSLSTPRYLTPPESRVAIPDGNIHTLGWAAPETRAGRPFTAKSDVYSLGLLLYRLLTGKLPTTKHQTEPISPRVHVPACPNDLAFAILGALNPDPEQRPSAEQLATHLEDALTTDEVLDEEATADAGETRTPTRPLAGARRAPAAPEAHRPRGPEGVDPILRRHRGPRTPRESRTDARFDEHHARTTSPPRSSRSTRATSSTAATTLEPDFAPPLPTTPRRRRSTALWAAGPAAGRSALLVWSMRAPQVRPSTTPPLHQAGARHPPAPSRRKPPAAPHPPRRQPRQGAHPGRRHPDRLRERGSQGGVHRGQDLAWHPHFTEIDIDSKSCRAAACLRGALTATPLPATHRRQYLHQGVLAMILHTPALHLLVAAMTGRPGRPRDLRRQRPPLHRPGEPRRRAARHVERAEGEAPLPRPPGLFGPGGQRARRPSESGPVSRPAAPQAGPQAARAEISTRASSPRRRRPRRSSRPPGSSAARKRNDLPTNARVAATTALDPEPPPLLPAGPRTTAGTAEASPMPASSPASIAAPAPIAFEDKLLPVIARPTTCCTIPRPATGNGRRTGRGLMIGGGATLGVGLALSGVAGYLGGRLLATRRDSEALRDAIDKFATTDQATTDQALIQRLRTPRTRRPSRSRSSVASASSSAPCWSASAATASPASRRAPPSFPCPGALPSALVSDLNPRRSACPHPSPAPRRRPRLSRRLPRALGSAGDLRGVRRLRNHRASNSGHREHPPHHQRGERRTDRHERRRGPSTTTATTEPATETGDSTGQPAELPSIVDYELTPNPIATNGPIVVIVTADHASGVRMDTGLGDIIELTPQPQPGLFIGEIAVLSGALNGPRGAADPMGEHARRRHRGGAVRDRPARARHREAVGDRRPDRPGSGRRHGHAAHRRARRARPPLARGRAALLPAPARQDGLWAPADIVDVLPDTPCEAVDLKIDDQGAVFVLVHQQTNNELFWRLLQLPAWGESAKHMGLGAKNEVAVALAHHDSGMVAVCGTAPRPGSSTSSTRSPTSSDLA
jgi:serine/threonine protein kinase